MTASGKPIAFGLFAFFLALGLFNTEARGQDQNLALTATAFASSAWEDGLDFAAAKANDNDPTTRWNAARGEENGSHLGLEWPAPVTFNKIVIDEDHDRTRVFHIEVPEGSDWRTIYNSAGTEVNPSRDGTPTHTILFTTPVTAKSVRAVFDEATDTPSVFEMRVYGGVPLGTVSGVVTGTDGTPIPGATVSINGMLATTDAEGRYSLTAEAGKTDITVAPRNTYSTRTARSVTIPANGTYTQDFILAKLPTNLALTATAEVSSFWDDDPNFDASKLIDGDKTTRWNSGAGDVTGVWVTFTWPSDVEFNTMNLYIFGDRVREFTLQRLDAATGDYADLIQQTIPDTGGNSKKVQVILPEVVKTRGVRLLHEAPNTSSIYEIEFLNTPLGTIKGVVADQVTGKGVPNATVNIQPVGTIATTDAQGAFQVVVSPDEYLASATAPGYLFGDPVVTAANAGQETLSTLTLTPTGPNLALGATATASFETENVATNVNDADPGTFWQTDADNMKEQWVALTFPQPTTFNAVWFKGFRGASEKSVLQILAEDGTTWVDLPIPPFNPGALDRQGLPPYFLLDKPVTTKGVRYFVFFTDSETNPASAPGLSEFEIYNIQRPTGPLSGDLNDDAKINVQDATLSLRIAVGLLTPTDAQKEAGDVNNDGKWNIQDTTLILQVAVGNKPASDLK